MRPFTAQINAKTSKATEYRTANAIIVALRQPHTLAVPLHMFIQNPRDREPYSTVSDASPWRLCAALYSAVTGEVMAWVTYRLPYEKDIVNKSSQDHREYLGHTVTPLVHSAPCKILQSACSRHFALVLLDQRQQWCVGVGGKKSVQIDPSQYACMTVSQLHLQNDIYMGAPIYRPGIDMGEIDAMSRMRDDETKASARIKELCPSLTCNRRTVSAMRPSKNARPRTRSPHCIRAPAQIISTPIITTAAHPHTPSEEEQRNSMAPPKADTRRGQKHDVARILQDPRAWWSARNVPILSRKIY